MKSIFFTTILISTFYSHSQLPTIYTYGGVKMVDWAKEKKKIELNEDENPFSLHN